MSKFIPPEPWELRRLFEIYKLQKPKRYAKLMEIKERDHEKFFRITAKLLHRQRLKDYRMRLRGLDPKKRELAANRKKIERLANQYYASPTQFHRQLIERELESTIKRQIEIQRAYENEKIEELHHKVSKIDHQWQSRRHPQQVEYLKRKVLWQASRSVYP